MTRLLTIDIRDEQGIVSARQRTRQVAELLGFDGQDQARLATAASELARNAVQYAGGGRAEFGADGRGLAITVRDQGPGIPDVRAVLDGRVSGAGLAGARRMVDSFDVESGPGGTTVRLGKDFPRGVQPPTGPALVRIADELARRAPNGPLTEIGRQNRELLQALNELRERDNRLAELNKELEATNKGVVALYAELEEKAESLRRASELKTRFLSNMSHEFRTPLNSIISLAQFLLDRADGPLTAEQERQVTFVRRAALGLSELVNDLLDLAKVEAGKVTMRVEEFTAADLFATLRGLMRPLHTNDAVALTFDDVAAVGRLRTDGGKVAQDLRNFLSNALKFTERGEVRASAEARPDGSVAFAVSDTGIGIAPADQAKIFVEFGQVENRFQKRVRGTGLGLSLSKRLAELLGGRVGVRSEPGAGSTFTLTVPRDYHAANEPPARRTAADGRVLVIDDDEIARYLLGSLLDGTGFEVIEAAGGEEGLRRAREDQPRAIFLDLAMPDLSGFEVLDELKAASATRDIPVIVYTSRVLGDADRARLEGRTVAVLPKGTKDPREVAARAVREVLGRAG
ncbi:MAG: response regulator, partial [Rhodospirillales bacterium]|nr:response regulator [Rhodospirillales bacterium]